MPTNYKLDQSCRQFMQRWKLKWLARGASMDRISNMASRVWRAVNKRAHLAAIARHCPNGLNYWKAQYAQ